MNQAHNKLLQLARQAAESKKGSGLQMSNASFIDKIKGCKVQEYYDPKNY